jgi:hypothetical protein
LVWVVYLDSGRRCIALREKSGSIRRS